MWTPPARGRHGVPAYLRYLRASRTSLTPLVACCGVIAAVGRSRWSVAAGATVLLGAMTWDYLRWRSGSES